MSDYEHKKRIEQMNNKIDAEWILKIVNMLFNEETDSKGNSISNLGVLFDIYMICVSRPEHINGIPLETAFSDENLYSKMCRPIELSPDSLYMKDHFGVVHSLDVRKVHEQIWKNRLNIDIDDFTKRIKEMHENDSTGS